MVEMRVGEVLELVRTIEPSQRGFLIAGSPGFSREMGRAIRQLQKMESIGQPTGGVAHDFYNMRAIVIGSLDLASRRIATEPGRASRYIDNAREGAERAAPFSPRLLAFSRQQPLAPVPINADRLVSGMSELLRHTLGEQIRVKRSRQAGCGARSPIHRSWRTRSSTWW